MTQQELFTNSWGLNSGFEKLNEALSELVPLQGKCDSPRSKNKNLERFRIASNLIYDLFNNALGNRRAEFRQFFGFMPLPGNGEQYRIFGERWKQIEDKMEPILTEIMFKAAKEQGIKGSI